MIYNNSLTRSGLAALFSWVRTDGEKKKLFRGLVNFDAFEMLLTKSHLILLEFLNSLQSFNRWRVYFWHCVWIHKFQFAYFCSPIYPSPLTRWRFYWRERKIHGKISWISKFNERWKRSANESTGMWKLTSSTRSRYQRKFLYLHFMEVKN